MVVKNSEKSHGTIGKKKHLKKQIQVIWFQTYTPNLKKIYQTKQTTFNVHSGKLTYQRKMDPFKMIFPIENEEI